jgi:heat shock protein 1/8
MVLSITIMSDQTDDTFELYDLRVEVICPPGARILCGAEPGDHFTLEGEMLRLPAGKGLSIYSLSACRRSGVPCVLYD